MSEIPMELLKRLPKTDLHCHLDGSLRLDTVLDLARQQNVKLPTFDRGQLFGMLYAGEHVTSLEDYLSAFDITLSVMQTEDSLERICTLPDSTVVYPGHGPATSIGIERATNPFLTGIARVVKR